jgi:hypothetical protein
MFDPELPVQIETDASDLAIGVCLTQEHHGNRMPMLRSHDRAASGT